MNVDRETVIEAGAALISVGIFIAILMLGASGSGPGLDSSGAYTVVGGIVAFVVVMSAIGYWLSTRE